VPAVAAGGAAWLAARLVSDVAAGFAGALLQLAAGSVAAAALFIGITGFMGTTRSVAD
jgi:hypothetical protein